ncbi:MAG: DUF1918 domain-containing protein [Solirubrobacteraceae bacterium]
MPSRQTTSHAHVGDWIEARGLYGQSARRGTIVGLTGGRRHERYRVHWDELHESIVYPAAGVVISPRRGRKVRRTSRARPSR